MSASSGPRLRRNTCQIRYMPATIRRRKIWNRDSAPFTACGGGSSPDTARRKGKAPLCQKRTNLLFRQTRFSQAVFKPREIFWSAKRRPMLDIADPQSGIERAQARHDFLRLREPPGERVACGRYAYRGRVIRLRP